MDRPNTFTNPAPSKPGSTRMGFSKVWTKRFGMNLGIRKTFCDENCWRIFEQLRKRFARNRSETDSKRRMRGAELRERKIERWENQKLKSKITESSTNGNRCIYSIAGKATVVFPDGTKEIRNYQDNKLTGPSVIFAANGDKLELNYVDGMVEGKACIKVNLPGLHIFH